MGTVRFEFDLLGPLSVFLGCCVGYVFLLPNVFGTLCFGSRFLMGQGFQP